MFNKVKIKMAVISMVAILLTLITQGTLAYYSTVGKATNVVTSGNLRLIIHETTDSGEEFPENGVYIVPGDIVSKEVTVENDCEHPFYLRVKIIDGINSLALSSDDCFKLNINEKFWQFHDGWYYYKDVVEPKETTPYVFSQVEIVGKNVDNRYIGKVLTLTVVAQAVQSENNPITAGNTFTAIGWPQE